MPLISTVSKPVRPCGVELVTTTGSVVLVSPVIFWIVPLTVQVPRDS
jgi:hypothetical protein